MAEPERAGARERPRLRILHPLPSEAVQSGNSGLGKARKMGGARPVLEDDQTPGRTAQGRNHARGKWTGLHDRVPDPVHAVLGEVSRGAYSPAGRSIAGYVPAAPSRLHRANVPRTDASP